MPRAPRIEFGGAIYHVMNRGDHLEPIVRDEPDRQRFVETLGEACASAGWQVHSFVLMPNHYHLLLETPRPTLVKGMQWLNATYTQRFNSRHRTRGHLFQGRYKALLVDGEARGYLLTVSDYIHLNPVRARLTSTATDLLRYRWCSAGWLAGTRRGRPDWLRWQRLYGELGWGRCSAKAQRQYRDYLRRRVSEVGPLEPRWKELRRGWCYGSEEFTARMKDTLAAALTFERGQETWSGLAVEEVEQERAARLMGRAIQVLGYSGVGAVEGRDRYLVARLLRSKTKVSVSWLADQFGLQTRGGMSYGIYEVGQQLARDKLLQEKWRVLASL